MPPGPPKVVIMLRTDGYKFDHLMPVETTFDGPERIRLRLKDYWRIGKAEVVRVGGKV